jgi:hypothetical protein
MAESRCGRSPLRAAALRIWPAVLLVTSSFALAACGSGPQRASLSTEATIAPPTPADLSAIRSAASRALHGRVSASLDLQAAKVFGAAEPDQTGRGTFDLVDGTGQVEVHQLSGIETVLFFPSMVFVRQPANSGNSLPPGKVWISTDLVQPETVSTNFAEFLLQVEDLNPALALAEMAWGAISAAPLGHRSIGGSSAQGYLVTVDLATAAAHTSGPAASALSKALQDERSASGAGPGTQAPAAQVRVWIGTAGQVVQIQASPAGSGTGTTLFKLSPYGPRLSLIKPNLAQVVDVASLTPLGERENNGRGDADGA